MLYYALGGGLGHLVRAKKLIQSQGLIDVKLITASPLAGKLFPESMLHIIPADWKNATSNIQQLLEYLLRLESDNTLYIDTFPCGILGELDIIALRKIAKIIYVARYVSWPIYLPKIHKSLSPDALMFDQTMIIDDLHPEQKIFIQQNSLIQQNVDLSNIDFSCTHIDAQSVFKTVLEKGSWLIIHSGNEDELDALISYALDISISKGLKPCFIVAGQATSTHDVQTYIRQLPHHIDLNSADYIVSGCGYNCMQELSAFSDKHFFMPFPRKYDDQFVRARKARETIMQKVPSRF